MRDVDLKTQIVTVRRKVIEIKKRFHPEGKRFLVVEYPKDKELRRFKLSAQICKKLKAHIAALELGPDDLGDYSLGVVLRFIRSAIKSGRRRWQYPHFHSMSEQFLRMAHTAVQRNGSSCLMLVV
jgi:hypothetical protein